MSNAPKLDSVFIEKQRQRLDKVRAELLAAARAGEADEEDVRSQSTNSGSGEYEDDAQGSTFLRSKVTSSPTTSSVSSASPGH